MPSIDIDIKYTGLRPGEKLYEELLTDAENTLPTYHEKIMIAKIRRSNLPDLQLKFSELISLAKQKHGSMEMVAKMKELVPEFVSNNSVFETLDQNKSNSNVVSINRAV